MSGDNPNEQEGLTQEDIDAALAASGDGAGEGETAPAGGGESGASGVPQPGATDAASPQEGADATTQGAAAEAAETAGGDESAPVGDGLLTQADIDAALEGANEPSETPATTKADGSPKLDSAGRPFDAAAAEMEAAIAAERAAAESAAASGPPASDKPAGDAACTSPPQSPPPPPPAGAVPLTLPDFGVSTPSASGNQGIELLSDVDLHVKIELGRAELRIEEVLQLGEGSVVELDKLAGDPVDILVNDKLVARGEVLVLNDNFCVRISEIVAGEELAAAG